MATATGTATDYVNLLTLLTTFLTTNTELVTANQNWTLELTETVGGETWNYFRGPGLAGTDNIHVNIRTRTDTGNNRYNWEIRGATSFRNTAALTADERWDDQPGRSNPVYMIANNASIEYWFYANGRRFIVIAKLGTFYSNMYGGFILPYGTPSEYGYPLLVASNSRQGTVNQSTQNYEIGSFWDPAGESFTNSSMFIYHPVGVWTGISAFDDSFIGTRPTSRKDISIWPIAWLDDMENENIFIDPAPGNEYALFPIILYANSISSTTGTPQTMYGELDNVYLIIGQSPILTEDTITIGSDTYNVFQSVYRTNPIEFCAIKQE